VPLLSIPFCLPAYKNPFIWVARPKVGHDFQQRNETAMIITRLYPIDS
jgi:hypothetical protein